MSDSWMRLKPSIDEPSKPIPSSERALELLRRDRERLQEPEHVGEPQTDEPDAPLLDRAQHVVGFGGQRHGCTVRARPRRLGYGAVTSGGRAPGRVYDARVLTPEMLGRTLAEAPDPELARVAISRVGRRPGRARAARPSRRAAGRGAAPGVLDRRGRLPGPPSGGGRDARRRPRADARRARRASWPTTSPRAAPRTGSGVFRRRAMLRVAARDLDGASLEDVVEEISRVAEACLEAACAWPPATSGWR